MKTPDPVRVPEFPLSPESLRTVHSFHQECLAKLHTCAAHEAEVAHDFDAARRHHQLAGQHHAHSLQLAPGG